MKKLIFLTLFFTVLAFAGDMKPLKIGEQVPSFVLKNYDGKEYALDTIARGNKFTVLMYVSTECPVSNAYNERMVKLYDAFSKKGIAFVGINSNKAESVSDIAEHSKEHSFKFPVLKDEQNKIADLYAAQVTPEIFVVNPKGALVYHGRIDDSKKIDKVTTNDLSNTLDALLAGKEIAQAETKAFGCSIKRIVAN